MSATARPRDAAPPAPPPPSLSSPGEPPPPDTGVARAVSGFALAVALALGLALPATWWLAGRAHEAAVTWAESRLAAALVSDLASRNPDLWRFETARILALLAIGRLDEGEAAGGPAVGSAVAHAPVGHTPERRRVLDAVGALVAEAPAEVPRPTFAARHPVHDSGHVVGWVEVTRSLRPLAAQTGAVGLASLLLALAAYAALRAAPMRLLRRATARAAHLATHDTLTGLPNRALFRDRLSQALAAAARPSGGSGGGGGDAPTVAVLCLDLDRFKEVNDTLGHAAGDALLREAAARLLAELRAADTLARLGGDEFAVVQVGARQPTDAEALARRLVAALSRPFDLDGHRAVVGTSVGVALAGAAASEARGEAEPERLLREADLALYRAKAEGRGTWRFFAEGMDNALRERKALEADLRAALAGGGFRLAFQPQVELDGRGVTGAEALLRWHHPQRGHVPPDRFVGLAEETGLILPLGAWVLREACAVAATWPAHLRVAVNVSPAQFRDGERLVAEVAAALAASGLDARRLELEITESLLLSDTPGVLATLERLRALGVTVAMDDFGTGYSSLATLRTFRFDKIKIDRSFVRSLGEDPQAAAIVRAVIGMSDALGVRANAEGVETEAQATQLRLEGCEEVQGYLFGRPMEADAFAALVAPRSAREEAVAAA